MTFPAFRSVHFLGVGGVSLSSLARFLAERGFSVSGTDRVHTPVLDDLREHAVRVWCGFEPALTGRPDLVVYSSALSKTDPELLYLRAAGVPCLERFAFLPYLSSLFRKTVAIAGTHGKTTVTSMCAVILQKAGVPFYAHIGGRSLDLGAYYHSGDDLLLIEACEYRRSFLSLRPDLGVVLNAELDHPDTYVSLSDAYDAFDDFLAFSEKKLVGSDSPYYAARQAASDAVTAGFSEGAFYRGEDVKQYENGCFGCRISHKGLPILDFRLRVPGRHNLADAVMSAAVCLTLGIPPETVRKGLSSFTGVFRRFSLSGYCRGVPVYVDYAHHPTAVREAIRTASTITRKPVAVVFQPHTYSRTAALLTGFSEALSLADALLVVKEYAARERPEDGCSAEALFRACRNERKEYAVDLTEAAGRALALLSSEPVGLLLILGAGDVYTIADWIVDAPSSSLL